MTSKWPSSNSSIAPVKQIGPIAHSRRIEVYPLRIGSGTRTAADRNVHIRRPSSRLLGDDWCRGNSATYTNAPAARREDPDARCRRHSKQSSSSGLRADPIISGRIHGKIKDAPKYRRICQDFLSLATEIHVPADPGTRISAVCNVFEIINAVSCGPVVVFHGIHLLLGVGCRGVGFISRSPIDPDIAACVPRHGRGRVDRPDLSG